MVSGFAPAGLTTNRETDISTILVTIMRFVNNRCPRVRGSGDPGDCDVQGIEQLEVRWHSSDSGRRWLECGGHGPSHPFISPFDESE